MKVRRTVVCRNESCGGGWWGDVPERCPHCSGRLLDLAPTYVTPVTASDPVIYQGDQP